MPSKLCSVATLQPGESLTSPSGRYTLTLGLDGILYLTDNNNTVLWYSPNMPQNSANIVCTIGTSGVLTIVDGSTVLWYAGVPVRGGACLCVEDDGDVVIQAIGTGQITWQTGTAHAVAVAAALDAARAGLDAVQGSLKSAERSFFHLLASRGNTLVGSAGHVPPFDQGGALELLGESFSPQETASSVEQTTLDANNTIKERRAI